jgi:hypothetical protein
MLNPNQTPQIQYSKQLKSSQPISSEHYRQMLVRDGDRRFHEWHTAYLQYQQQFLRQLEQSRQR